MGKIWDWLKRDELEELDEEVSDAFADLDDATDALAKLDEEEEEQPIIVEVELDDDEPGDEE